MKIVICNAGYSGYSTACWRELASRSNVDLSIYTPRTVYPFAESLLSGLPVHVLSGHEMADGGRFCETVIAEHPDVIVIPGWTYKCFTSLCFHPGLRDVKIVMAVDSAWEGSLRQLVSRIALFRLVKRLDGIIVAGERGRQFARYLGFSPERIFTSTYGFDYRAFSAVAERRRASESWPRSFVYVGRYVTVKGLDVLADAYRQYSRHVLEPWPLHCYGHGPLKERLQATAGVTVHDFVQPAELPATLAKHGVYLLPSLNEPWGVSLAEAAATALPCICSDKVSSGIDMVRHLYNGLVFAAGNAEALARCFCWAHEHVDYLPEMGRRAQIYAEAYSAEHWADRWLWCADSILSATKTH